MDIESDAGNENLFGDEYSNTQANRTSFFQGQELGAVLVAGKNKPNQTDREGSDDYFVAEGGDAAQRKRPKRKISDDYKSFPIYRLKISDLPKGFQTEMFLDKVKHWGSRVVFAVVKGASENRPEFYKDTSNKYPFSEVRGTFAQHHGSGYIHMALSNWRYDRPCECASCQQSEIPASNSWYYLVITANHVVYDDYEATKTTFRCFYDIKTNVNKYKLYGIEVFTKGQKEGLEDMCIVICVTHDEVLHYRLKEITSDYTGALFTTHQIDFGMPVTLISHPNGHPKRVSFGKIQALTINLSHLHQRSKPIAIPDSIFCILPFRLLSLISWEDLLDGFQIALNTLPTGVKIEADNIPTILRPYNVLARLEIQVKLAAVNVKSCRKVKLHFIKDGIEYLPEPEELFIFPLPVNFSFVLPEHAQFAYKFIHSNGLHFPAGTKFQCKGGKTFFIPRETWFQSERQGLNTNECYCSLSYDIASEPSSSGGLIAVAEKLSYKTQFLERHYKFFPHAGSSSDAKVSVAPLFLYSWNKANSIIYNEIRIQEMNKHCIKILNHIRSDIISIPYNSKENRHMFIWAMSRDILKYKQYIDMEVTNIHELFQPVISFVKRNGGNISNVKNVISMSSLIKNENQSKCARDVLENSIPSARQSLFTLLLMVELVEKYRKLISNPMKRIVLSSPDDSTVGSRIISL